MHVCRDFHDLMFWLSVRPTVIGFEYPGHKIYGAETQLIEKPSTYNLIFRFSYFYRPHRKLSIYVNRSLYRKPTALTRDHIVFPPTIKV